MKNSKFIGLALIIAVMSVITSSVFMFGKNVSAQNKADTGDLARKKAFADSLDKANENGTVRVIVKLRQNTKLFGQLNSSEIETQASLINRTRENILQKLSKKDESKISKYEFIPYFAMEADASDLLILEADENVAGLEEDILLKPSLEQSLQIVGAPTAWSAGFSGIGKTVAVIDSGTQLNHPFFAGKIVSEACYSSGGLCPGGATQSTATGSGNNCDPSINGCAHGTHVAGIAVGKDTARNKFGVARDASLISINTASRVIDPVFCNNRVPCVTYFYSDVLRGLERVLVLKGTFDITSVNMSLGSGLFTSNCDTTNPAMKMAIDNLRSVGVATTISAMNNASRNSIGFPACISSAISVGSTEDAGVNVDKVSGFSNSASFLSLLAPGSSINSSVLNSGYGNMSGTSMAAPHVAGAWAILKQRSPNATVDQILEALVKTGKPVLDTGNNITKPRINVNAALEALKPKVQ
jgi:subtilisin